MRRPQLEADMIDFRHMQRLTEALGKLFRGWLSWT